MTLRVLFIDYISYIQMDSINKENETIPPTKETITNYYKELLVKKM